MEDDKVLATEAKEIAEEKIVTGHDVLGAMTLALKARRLYPRLEGIDQLISVLDILVVAADSNDYNGNKDYYKILRVDQNAEYDVIKKQYRKIALNVHPDKNPSVGADEAFKIVFEAFEVLSDKRKRQIYDQGVWRGLSEISEMDADSIFSKEWEKRKMQMSKEDAEELQRGINRNWESWKIRRTQMSNEHIQSLRSMDAESIFSKEWEKRKMQMSKEDAEELQSGINRDWEVWKIRRTQMSNEHIQSLRSRIQQEEEGWKKRRTQMSEDDIEDSRRKMREEWQKKISQSSDEYIQRLQRKMKNDREEWEKQIPDVTGGY